MRWMGVEPLAEPARVRHSCKDVARAADGAGVNRTPRVGPRPTSVLLDFSWVLLTFLDPDTVRKCTVVLICLEQPR
jgi:hypothetical protein